MCTEKHAEVLKVVEKRSLNWSSLQFKGALKQKSNGFLIMGCKRKKKVYFDDSIYSRDWLHGSSLIPRKNNEDWIGGNWLGF